ncbi:hypothetical protein AMATHDRAFT_38017 [Amanita thiersii Skay4041]|uniref:SH3 domain-containing protein n=1 Tax=Amanita thiersii Skay4041 TaxID=703135 RepID=A0A2A9P0T6_9AGAR|nr:hypothetical protein AMATHDRAFT_38017 [Amanita thiersii Skay4041]
MKLNNPIPQSLPKECEKAARIFKSFVDSGNNGLDGVIPRHILQNARGFAIFTVFKAGFLFSARAGSGIVIARLPNGSWSAPSAIGTAGVGVGGQAGAEMTDFLVVLNSRAAIRSFMAAGSLSLGGNMSIALGPLGRNGEASGSVNTSGKVAAMYSYSKTRGLFGGVSLEGSVIVERQDANTQAYSSPVTVKLLLSGMVDSPPWASHLIRTLETCTGAPGSNRWIDDSPDPFMENSYAFGGMPSSETTSPSTRSHLKKKRPDKAPFPPTSWGQYKESGSYFDDDDVLNQDLYSTTPSSHPDTSFDSDYRIEYDNRPPSHVRSRSMPHSHGSKAPFSAQSSHTKPWTSPSSGPLKIDDDNDLSMLSGRHAPAVNSAAKEGVAQAVALYNFQAVEPGDMSFFKGEVIIITQMTDKTDDWWTGKIGDRKGLFPANFVEVV